MWEVVNQHGLMTYLKCPNIVAIGKLLTNEVGGQSWQKYGKFMENGLVFLQHFINYSHFRKPIQFYSCSNFGSLSILNYSHKKAKWTTKKPTETLNFLDYSIFLAIIQGVLQKEETKRYLNSLVNFAEYVLSLGFLVSKDKWQYKPNVSSPGQSGF